MNIMDLDEAQGLTAEMVRLWLRCNGWMHAPESSRWRFAKTTAEGDAFADRELDHDPLRVVVGAVAVVMGYKAHDVQALLRDINPRMRKGVPSGAAIASSEWWVVRVPEDAGGDYYGDERTRPGIDVWHARFISQERRTLADDSPEFSFWPCDENGNKVRWPVDDKGVML